MKKIKKGNKNGNYNCSRAFTSCMCPLQSRAYSLGARLARATVYIIPLCVNQKNICEHAKNLLTMLVLFGIIYIENERKVIFNVSIKQNRK